MRDEGHDAVLGRVVSALREPVRVGSLFDARVMAVVRRLPTHRRVGLWSRLRQPQTVTLTPLSWGLLAAAFVAVVALDVSVHLRAARAGRADDARAGAVASGPDAQRRVQFVLVAPTAKKVAVVGDFNGWDASHLGYLAKHQGGGVWSVTAPVPLGNHRYAFVVDDSVWVADPAAPRAMDDDYGLPNSTLYVGESVQ